MIGAGYRSSEMISSQNALLYAYAFYLLGRQHFAVSEHQLSLTESTPRQRVFLSIRFP
jgi:hypothetical protein